MRSKLGQDAEGKYWFKSDTHLVDVTNAFEFKVVKSGLFKTTYCLYAVFITEPARYLWDNKTGYEPPKLMNKLLGEYYSETGVSLALDTLMYVKKIKEIDTFTPPTLSEFSTYLSKDLDPNGGIEPER